MKEEGVSALFTGWHLACVKAAMTNFIFFYNMRVLAPLLKSHPLLQGMAAGVGVQLVTLPVDMLVTRVQTNRGHAGAWLVLRGILVNEGVRSLWTGLGPGLLLVLNPGITQFVLARIVGKSEKRISALRAFCAGATAKAVASVCTYPSTRAKVQMQVQGMVPKDSSKSPNTLQVLRTIVGEGGFSALFDGLLPQLTNAVLKDAILTMVRVKIASFVAHLLKALRRNGKQA
jgi:hypothetical protein